MEKKQKKLIEIKWIYDFWKEWENNLEKKDIEINVVDFDSTLFSRNEQLEWEKELFNHRWDNWVKFIFEKIWMSKFLDKYYKNKEIPKNIISKLDSKYDVIMTAWPTDFQFAKVRLCKQLDDFKMIVTKNWKEKIVSLIRYVLFDLKFIPKKITIYEDRPQYFIEYRDFLEDVLLTKLEIMKVEMNWNDCEPDIKKISN